MRYDYLKAEGWRITSTSIESMEQNELDRTPILLHGVFGVSEESMDLGGWEDNSPKLDGVRDDKSRNPDGVEVPYGLPEDRSEDLNWVLEGSIGPGGGEE